MVSGQIATRTRAVTVRDGTVCTEFRVTSDVFFAAAVMLFAVRAAAPRPRVQSQTCHDTLLTVAIAAREYSKPTTRKRSRAWACFGGFVMRRGRVCAERCGKALNSNQIGIA